MDDQRSFIGSRLKRLRQARGFSRQEIAGRLHVDVTAVCAWEGGRYLPRPNRRFALAHLLAADIDRLFSVEPDERPEDLSANLVDSMKHLPELLLELLNRTFRGIKALRLAAPYPTPAHAQKEFRAKLMQRLLAGTIEVQRIEIIYDLDRLNEILSNIIRYDGHPYFVKSHCAGLQGIVPAVGGYFFDDREFVLGGYWNGVPPHDKPSLRLSGEAFRSFFTAYWHEIWSRGTLLNMRGSHDLSAVRDTALRLGLPAADWPQFVEEACALEIGDGAPPLI